MGFSRQQYGSRLPFPSSGRLADPRIEPVSPALAGRFSITEPAGKLQQRVRMPFPPPLKVAKTKHTQIVKNKQ